MAIRSVLHCAGAAALGQLLHYGPPALDQRRLPCACGRQAQYIELRTKQVLTALGPTRMERPYYLCLSCHRGQFPVDRELDVQGTALSPAVRRMMGLIGHEVAFNRGRAQLKLLADLTVTAKAVERTAEAIGRDILAHHQQEIRRAKQLELPVVAGPRIPILYIQADGTGVPVTNRRDTRQAWETTRPARPYARSQTRLCLHADWNRCGGPPSPGRKLDQLRRRH
jgi:hypothetical protein